MSYLVYRDCHFDLWNILLTNVNTSNLMLSDKNDHVVTVTEPVVTSIVKSIFTSAETYSGVE